jgi:RNA polymerase sigma-70 factor (ECF subfamily)
MNSEWKTRKTLIQRAKNPSDEEAWHEFVSFYKMFIYYLLHRMNVTIEDMDDLVQEILVTLWRKLNYYKSEEAKFRTWLSTVIRNTTLTFLKRQGAYKAKKDKLQYDIKLSGTFSEPEMDRIVEREWKNYITNLAMQRLKKVFAGNALAAFQSGIDGLSAEKAAQNLGISVDSIYTLRGRVKKRFIREIKFLMNELEF